MALKFLGDRDKFYVYPWYMADLASTADMKKLVGLNVEKSLIHIKNSFVNFYFEEKSTNNLGRAVLKRITKDKKYYKKISKQLYALDKEMDVFCKKIEKTDVKKASDERLLRIYERYIKQSRKIRVWGWLPNFLDGLFENFLTDLITEKFKAFLEEKGKAKDKSKFYSVLSSSEKMSEVQTEELARLDLLLKIKKEREGKKIFKLIKTLNKDSLKKEFPKEFALLEKHIKKYGWLTYSYIGPTMSISHLLNLLRENLEKGSILLEKNRLLSHYEKIKKQKKDIAKKLKLTPELIHLFNVSSEMMFIKDFRKSSYMKSYVAMDSVMKELARRLEMSIKEIKFLVFDEVKEAIEKNKEAYFRKIAKKRTKECCYLAKNGKIKFFEGKATQKMLKNLQKEENAKQKNQQELQGKTAYTGKAKGIAKVVLVVGDVPKVKPGDILISSSTNPDLIAAMKKASAFVTDFGGITSHAAIVSREMKKPCVVGTKYATSIIRDGDLIEVDADKGQVKIIKKNK